ncbi:MAG TPA: hypothetical protein VND94_00640 [Terriglobia bacterium]|nr:hypothetical protein [Terriglobia bacterium]
MKVKIEDKEILFRLDNGAAVSVPNDVALYLMLVGSTAQRTLDVENGVEDDDMSYQLEEADFRLFLEVIKSRCAS